MIKIKGFTVVFGSFVLTTALLYFIGYKFTLPWLMFHYEYTDTANGFFVTTGSMVPLIVGLAVSFFSEKVYFNKYKR